MTPEVSVLMSVHNGEKYLRESVTSILSQTLHNLELIIVDDGSNDSTRTILNSLSDSRINFINNKYNIGLTKSLNKALNFAKGKYVARHDSDDISLPYRLEKQKRELEKENLTLCATGVYHMYNESKIRVRHIPPSNQNVLNKILLRKNVLTHSSIMFRNNLGIRYRDKFYYAQDYDLYLRLISENTKIGVLPECLLKYRVSNASISLSKRVYQFLFMEKAKQFFHERLLYGKDSYDVFDPLEILSLETQKIDDLSTLRAQLNAYFCSGDYRKLRLLYQEYYKKFHLDKYIILYIGSFIPKHINSAINILTMMVKFKMFKY